MIKKGIEGQTSRNHPSLTIWMPNTNHEPTPTPEMERIIDTRMKQYGTGLVYGSRVEPAGGSVVQNVPTVASNRVPYIG